MMIEAYCFAENLIIIITVVIFPEILDESG